MSGSSFDDPDFETVPDRPRRSRLLIAGSSAGGVVIVIAAIVFVARCGREHRSPVATTPSRAGALGVLPDEVLRALDPETRRLYEQARRLLDQAQAQDSDALRNCVETALLPALGGRPTAPELGEAIQGAARCFDERTEMAALDALGADPRLGALFNGDRIDFGALLPRGTPDFAPPGGDHAEVALRHVPEPPPEPARLTGVIDDRALARAMNQHRGLVDACFARRRRELPRLHGKLDLRLVVARDGRVTDVTVVGNTTRDTEFGDCVQRAVRGLQVPPPVGGPASAPFAFLFQPGSH